MFALAIGTTLMATLLSGCATGQAPRAQASASETTQARGPDQRAIQQAEAAVLATPHDPALRLTLGNAYLDAGRFASAETAFADAMTLGDASPRAALSLALAQLAQADYADAAALLNQWEGEIAGADLGLALALAGQPERSIHIMSNAIRGGQNTVKMRQNLAYAYAMAGRWREARLMVQQDLPAAEVGARMEQWSRLAPAEAYQHRIAALLQVPVGVRDEGLPMHLALDDGAAFEYLAEATVPDGPTAELAMAAPATIELPAIETVPVPASTRTPAPANSPDPAPGARRMVQASAQQPAATLASAPGTHLVQLGSFLSEQGARRAWDVYVGRYPELAARELVVTEALVNGRRYWRVSAGGFDQSASRALCGKVRANGDDGCVTWAQGRPLPGAVNRTSQLARR
jgi:Flp pilus assembly protein TadD